MSGSGPQPLRNFPGNIFQSQQPTSQRTQTLGSGRLQNGKLSNTSNWGYNFGTGSGLLSQQVRGNTNPTTFSQAIGGGQSQATLDPSEFPSLSGGPQSAQQQANSALQSTWGSGTRISPNSAGPRSQNNTNINSQAIQPPSQMTSSHRRAPDLPKDTHTSPFSQFGGLDDYRFNQGGQAISGHSSEQHGTADDFPPLGGLGSVEVGIGQRNGTDQVPSTSGSSNGASFRPVRSVGHSAQIPASDHAQDASSQSGDRIFSPVDGSLRSARSPFDQLNAESLPRQDQQSGRFSRNSGQEGFVSSQTSGMPYRSNPTGDPRYQQSIQESSDSSEPRSSGRTGTQSSSSQMSEIDRWGIPGLIEVLRGGTSDDQAALALGMDLSALGLDVHRPGNSPLHVDWPGPFSEPLSRPIIPEFTLPQAYTVTNVPPLHTRIGSFSDDTLFMIFYQNPRDESQEMAAQELYKRDWRWHKKLQQWMMKAAEAPEPRVDPIRNEERGWYYFWDANSWRRERREFLLSYDHLHHPMSQQPAEEALSSRS